MNTRSISILAALALCCPAVMAQSEYVESHPEFTPKTSLRPDKVVLLYPEGQAAGKGIVEDGITVTLGPKEDNGLRGEEINDAEGNRRNIGDDARMDLYFPKKGNGCAVVVAPGGGYGFVSSFNEGAYVAKWLTDHGFVACVLKYRMPAHHQTVPLDDIQNALRYCRYHSPEWGVKQTGVMGFSAGGHLVATAATMYVDAATRPDFAVLIYPRVTLRRGESNGTKNNLIGSDKEWEGREAEFDRLLEYWSPENHVDGQTPPCFIALSANDRTVKATNVLPFYSKLIESGVNVEMHVFPTGGHGWGFSYEKYKGEGRDQLAPYRADFEAALLRWIGSL